MPERLEISHARNEKDHSLDAPYVENFSHTEYQSEATVYAYLKQVSDFFEALPRAGRRVCAAAPRAL